MRPNQTLLNQSSQLQLQTRNQLFRFRSNEEKKIKFRVCIKKKKSLRAARSVGPSMAMATQYGIKGMVPNTINAKNVANPLFRSNEKRKF